MTLTGAALAASYDPRPGDEARLENAAARRLTAHANYIDAKRRLRLAELRDANLQPFVRNLNEAVADLEHAEYDCRRARWRFDADTATCRFCHKREPIVRGTYTRIQFADGISLVCDTCSSRADGR